MTLPLSLCPCTQRPLLRHLVLTFWSLLPPSLRGHGLLRLLDGVRALAAAQARALHEDTPGAGPLPNTHK